MAAVAVATRAAAAARAGGLYPDGAVELEAARAFAAGRWGDALETRFHPLLGGLTGGLHALGGGGGDPAALERTAAALVVLGSAAAAPALAWAAARACPARPRTAALAAGLLAALHPMLARLGGQVLAHALGHAALAVALALALVAVARLRGQGEPGPAGAGRAGRGDGEGGAGRAGAGLALAGAAGAAVGLGYLARLDALASGAGVLSGLALAAPRGRRVASGLCFVAGALLVMSPYLLAMRAHAGAWRLSLKKDAGALVLGLTDALGAVRTPGTTDGEPSPPGLPGPGGAVGPMGVLGIEALWAAETQGWAEDADAPAGADARAGADTRARAAGVGAAGAADRPGDAGAWTGALGEATRKAAQAADPPLVALAAIGLALAWRGRRRAPTAWWLAVLACGGLCGVVAGQVALKAVWGYTSRLHAAGAGVPVVALAAIAALALPRARPRGPAATGPDPSRGGIVRATADSLRGQPGRKESATPSRDRGDGDGNGESGGSRRPGRPAWALLVARPRAPLALGLAAWAAFAAPRALEPQRAAYAVEASLGRSLRALHGPGPLALAGRDARVVAWHAGARWVDWAPADPPSQAVARARAAGARFLVAFVRARGPRPRALDAALAAAGARPLPSTLVERAPVRYEWLMFDLAPPERLPP